MQCKYESGQILKMLNDISPSNGQCPAGFDDIYVLNIKGISNSFLYTNIVSVYAMN